jgi:hypothetical protein
MAVEHIPEWCAFEAHLMEGSPWVLACADRPLEEKRGNGSSRIPSSAGNPAIAVVMVSDSVDPSTCSVEPQSVRPGSRGAHLAQCLLGFITDTA